MANGFPPGRTRPAVTAAHRGRPHIDVACPCRLLGSALTDYFASPARVRLGEVALWHAPARARTVILRRDRNTLTAFTRRPDETVSSFVERLAAGTGPDPTTPDPASAGLAILYRADVPVGPGFTVHALLPAGLDPAAVRLLTVDDLVASLAARPAVDEEPAAA
jgi:hypothetical protein